MEKFRKIILGAGLLITMLFGVNTESSAHSVQVAYCANCSSTLRIFFEHWHGCTVNPATSGTITISIQGGGPPQTTTGYPVANICNTPLASLPGCNTPPTKVASCVANENNYNDWWVYDFPAAKCGVPITITASNPSNAYTADCGGMFPVSWTFTIPCNVNKPVASFSVVNDSICVGGAMNFNNLSTGGNPGLSYVWDFGDGSPTSTATNPSHTYAAPGNYCVQLSTTKQSGGCADDTTICVTVLGQPVINIPAQQMCAGTQATLTANATPGGGTYNWTPGAQTTQSITVSPGATTTYTVNYTAPSGCQGSGTGTVTVNPNPIADFTFDSVCFGSPTNFADLSAGNGGTITGWNWDFGDGSGTSTQQSPSYQYGSNGTFTVKLVITTADGCMDSITYNVPVSTPVNPGFSFTDVCLNNITQFTDTTTAAFGTPSVWNWYFGDGNTSTQQHPSHTYANPGTYNVKLVVGTGPTCKDSVTQTVTVYDMPVPGFNFTDECANTAVNFTNTSNIGTGSITGYQWDFGDGSPGSTQTNPSHTYTKDSTYSVKLIVTSNNGCVDSITQTVTIYALPNTDFTFDTVCQGNQTCFQDLTTVTNSNITGWQWVFGDGSPTNNNANPCHTYATAGTYTVTLITTSGQGCTGTKTHTITVNALPTADFNTGNVCQNVAAQFNDQSTIPADSIVNWQWDFGNGVTSTQKNPNYQYPAAGTYTVQLIALPPAGYVCADTISKQITIHPMPNADFNFTNVCFEDTNQFTDVSNVATGAITNWQWDFGNGNNGNNQNESQGYNQEGNYMVELVVTTDSGCTDTVSKQIAVYGKPVVDFDPTSVCEGVNTQFSDRSSLNFGQYQSWTWKFGDGSGNQSGQNTSHLYPGSGSYVTTLIVSTTDGCIDSANKTVWVNPVPDVDFVGDKLEGCDPVCTNFTDQTAIASGNIATYSWDFGDGGFASSANPTHCFENKGLSPLTFDVKLTATSDSGCTATVTKASYISVYPYPIAEFETDKDVVKISNPIIEFRDLSRGNNTWTWDFGDGTTNTTSLKPVHQYKDTGKFITWLYIENQWGCRDSTVKVLEVDPEFFIYIPNAFTPDDDFINDLWYPKVFGAETMDTYIFDRWGELIWEGHQLDSKWDGTYKGQRTESEVFVYLVKVRTVLGEDKEFRGKVTLLK